MRSFKLGLLRSEISQANADSVQSSVILAKAGENVRRDKGEKWWPSVIFYLNLRASCRINNLIRRHKKSLKNFRKDKINH